MSTDDFRTSILDSALNYERRMTMGTRRILDSSVLSRRRVTLPTPVMSYNTNANTKARALTSTLQLAQLTEQSLQPTVCSGLDPRPAGND
uniref:Uncharacterized protein n=1 Tax=Timema shepardi TaxID=629360 RepID=A0A7R9AVD4_TIMSH|nr:unnamed protein product [Timema shepardi]